MLNGYLVHARNFVLGISLFSLPVGACLAVSEFGSLPRNSAPGAYDYTPAADNVAASSTSRVLRPPSGIPTFNIETGLSLSVSAGASWHSNPERSDDDFESDASISLTPSIGLGGNIGRHAYSVRYTTGTESFQDFKTADSDFNELSGLLKLDLSRILIADIYASRAEGTEKRGVPGSRDLAPGEKPDEFTVDTLGGRVTLGRRSNLLQLMFGASTEQIEFTNNNQSDRNRDQDNIEAGLFFNVGPRTSFFIHGNEATLDYLGGNPSLDNTETSITAGVTWDVTEAVSLFLEAGNLEKKYDDPAIAGYDDTTYTGKILWNPTDRNNVALYVSKRTEESSDSTAAFYVSDLVGIDFNQSIGGRGSMTIYYAIADEEFSSGRVDEVVDYGISFGYSAYSWLNLGISYNVIERNSSITEESFDDEIYSIFASFTPSIGN